MLSKKMSDAINRQINAELYSAYLYLAMAAYFKDRTLDGFAQWMETQAQEEMSHAHKFYQELFERGGRAVLDAIDKPPAEWDSAKEVFDAVYEHEKKVTAMIDDLVDLANSDNDHASQVFLQWFVSEQVEEEASAKGICDKLELVGNHPQALLMLDRELGQRVFNTSGGEE